MHKKFLTKFKILYFILPVFLFYKKPYCQVVISGTVYDSTTIYSVPNVMVKSSSGGISNTDSAGVYHIKVLETDSISFFYRNKSTAKFPVSSISNYNQFDISLRVRVSQKYKALKEVVVFSKSYRQDSLENRTSYNKIYNYNKPQLGTDINELISIFRFRKNKQAQQFQKRLIEQEQDSYVDYRFNTTLLKRVTGLKDSLLIEYKKQYRPDYRFITLASDVEFYEYILYTSDKFKKDNNLE